MKSTGIVRKVDHFGRIVIPKELRKALNVVELKDSLEIFLEDSTIVLRKISFEINSAILSRKVDRLGRIVLPIEIRRNLDIVEEKDALEIFVEEDKLYLKKYEPACVFCQNFRNVIYFKGRNVCRSCIEELKEM